MKYTSYILAFQLCVILGFSSYLCQAISIKEIENLKEHFNATKSDVADNETLFSNVLKNWREESDRKIFQSQIVSFYFKLFDSLKDNQNIQSSVEAIKEDLRVKFFNSSNSKMEDFKKLIQIPVNDLKVQRKAINELIRFMNELAPGSTLRKRRRSPKLFHARSASK
ncbi:interferon gamma [Phyllostomus discolor]|uniref:Interferon gamma n=1 Tax=Phyllostomus discolor TaxID=89673 RepID=A0A6J2NH43_9CHIR|nr:interferon gamma [Phyllostomus discolor]KAF6119075.1 interferon gamma [Phyllostomus discolor]